LEEEEEEEEEDSNPIQCDVTGAGSPLCPHLK